MRRMSWLATAAAAVLFAAGLSAQGKPDFAGHYVFAGWGCGSVCAAGALVDLKSGRIHPPPGRTNSDSGWSRWIFAGGFVDGPYLECRANSRLMLIRENGHSPEYERWSYYEWTGVEFRLLHRSERKRKLP